MSTKLNSEGVAPFGCPFCLVSDAKPSSAKMDNKSKTDTVTQVLGFIGHHLRVLTITGIHLLGMQTMTQEGNDRTKTSLRHRRTSARAPVEPRRLSPRE